MLPELFSEFASLKRMTLPSRRSRKNRRSCGSSSRRSLVVSKLSSYLVQTSRSRCFFAISDDLSRRRCFRSDAIFSRDHFSIIEFIAFLHRHIQQKRYLGLPVSAIKVSIRSTDSSRLTPWELVMRQQVSNEQLLRKSYFEDRLNRTDA
jgi:hypothetical protein